CGMVEIVSLITASNATPTRIRRPGCSFFLDSKVAKIANHVVGDLGDLPQWRTAWHPKEDSSRSPKSPLSKSGGFGRIASRLVQLPCWKATQDRARARSPMTLPPG